MDDPRFHPNRGVEFRWPHGSPGDGGPDHAFDGSWWPERTHIPFNPPDYWDWADANSHDFRDRNWRPEHIDSLTGLPPPSHQGHEYAPGPWRWSNGSGRPGNVIRWNEPALAHPHGKKRRLVFVWPSDGKCKNTSGRWKDILSGKGPDIFVTRAGDRPSRNQWKNDFQDFTPEDPGFNTHVDAVWAKREKGKKYDFRERRYRRKKGVGDVVWSDATWPRHGADGYKYPLSYRCEHGDWYNLAWSPFGGVPLEGYSTPVKRSGILA